MADFITPTGFKEKTFDTSTTESSKKAFDTWAEDILDKMADIVVQDAWKNRKEIIKNFFETLSPKRRLEILQLKHWVHNCDPGEHPDQDVTWNHSHKFSLTRAPYGPTYCPKISDEEFKIRIANPQPPDPTHFCVCCLEEQWASELALYGTERLLERGLCEVCQQYSVINYETAEVHFVHERLKSDENGPRLKKQKTFDMTCGVDLLEKSRHTGTCVFKSETWEERAHEFVLKAMLPEYFERKKKFGGKDKDTTFQAQPVYDLQNVDDSNLQETYKFFIACLYRGMTDKNSLSVSVPNDYTKLLRIIMLADYYQVRWLVAALMHHMSERVTQERVLWDADNINNVVEFMYFAYANAIKFREVDIFDRVLFWFTYNQCQLPDLSRAIINNTRGKNKTCDMEFSTQMFTGSGWCKEEYWTWCYVHNICTREDKSEQKKSKRFLRYM